MNNKISAEKLDFNVNIVFCKRKDNNNQSEASFY